MTWKSSITVILGAIFTFALGATQAAYGAPPTDACSMFPASQLQKILGQPFGAPKESKFPPAYGKQPWGTRCEYSSQKGPHVDVTFIVYIEQTASEAKQTFDKLSVWFPAKSKAAIGDSAYIDTHGAIHVLKGKVRYFISIDPANEKQLNDLAASVAAGI
jgi:hypothetical protein